MSSLRRVYLLDLSGLYGTNLLLSVLTLTSHMPIETDHSV